MSDRQSPGSYNSPNNTTLISTSGSGAGGGGGAAPGSGYIYLQQQQQPQPAQHYSPSQQQQQLCYQSLSGNFINGGGQSLLYSTAGNGGGSGGQTVQSQFYSQYHPSALQYQHHTNVINVGGAGGVAGNLHNHHQQQYKKGTLRNNADVMKRTRTQNA